MYNDAEYQQKITRINELEQRVTELEAENADLEQSAFFWERVATQQRDFNTEARHWAREYKRRLMALEALLESTDEWYKLADGWIWNPSKG